MAVALATRAVGGTWSVEILADYTSLGFHFNSLHPASSLSFDASGKAHLAVGHRYSLAKSSGSFFQPPALYFESTPSGWNKSEITDEGIINQRSLNITSQGEVLIAYGALGAIGQQDRVMLHQVGGGADELVLNLANLIGHPNPMALLTHGGGIQVVMRDQLVRQQDSPGSWSTTTWPLAENTLLDATRGADGQNHLLISRGYIGVYVLTPAP